LVPKRKLAQELTGEWDWSLVPYLKARDFNFPSATRF
jgi:hypothetical protein